MPAVDRYLSPRVALAKELAADRRLPLLILSGVYGVLRADEGVPRYDHALQADEVEALVPQVVDRLRELEATGLVLVLRDRGHAGLGPLPGRHRRGGRSPGADHRAGRMAPGRPPEPTMKVLVTGGAGYVGSVAVEALLAEGAQVVVLDDLSEGHRAAVHPDAAFVQTSLTDRGLLAEVFARHRPDAVMHFAARSLVGESMERPLLYLRDNVVCGLNLLEATVEAGVRRFILSSTAALFGAPERVPIDEDERITPGSPYGEGKQTLERALFWLERTSGLRYATLRYFNAAGASPTRGEDHRPETHLVPIVLQVALGRRDRISIFGDDYVTPDGTCVRDYIHVVDLASAHLLALKALDGGSRVYNLGSGLGFSVLEVVEAARRVTGHPIPAGVVARRPGDPPTLVASSDRIRQELGWRPRFADLESIVRSAWDWHRANPLGYPE